MISKFSIKKMQVSKGWALEVFHFPLFEWYLREVGKKKNILDIITQTPVSYVNSSFCSTPVLFVRWKWHFVHLTDFNGSPISTPQFITFHSIWFLVSSTFTIHCYLESSPTNYLSLSSALVTILKWHLQYTATVYRTRSLCLTDFKVYPSSTAMEKWSSHL